MRVEEELAELAPERDMLLTVGVFDGVHLGHQYLISQLTGSARQQGLLSGVVTFRRHPREVLSPRTRLPYLTNLAEKVRLLKNEGVEAVIPLSFTPELAQLRADEFVGLLKKLLRMRGLIIGPDFALGRSRGGDIERLRQLGKKMDFSVTVIQPIMLTGEVVSSTAIREALGKGDMAKVNRLIGRLFRLPGKVTTGTGRGSELGFPTANLEVEAGQALPADGVYATWSHIEEKTCGGVTNIGRRPTFDGQERTIETFIFNCQDNLYGSELKIDFVERLRSEKRFNSVEELKTQIAEDVKRGQAVLDSRNSDMSAVKGRPGEKVA